jgi:hypothetical protein
MGIIGHHRVAGGGEFAPDNPIVATQIDFMTKLCRQGRTNKKRRQSFLVNGRSILPSLSNLRRDESKRRGWSLVYLIRWINDVLRSKSYTSPRGIIKFQDIVRDKTKVYSFIRF